MQSKAKDVAAYLQEIPPERQGILIRLRDLCRQTLTGYEEKMEYGMPCYKKNGVVAVAFASQKNYLSPYIKQNVVNAHRDALTGASVGKGCIRFSRPDKMDLTVIEKLLTDTANAPETSY